MGDIQRWEGDYVQLEDEIEDFQIKMAAEIRNGVVDCLWLREGPREFNLDIFYAEPYLLERFIAFLRAVQKEER